jgi:hypothetical protein
MFLSYWFRTKLLSEPLLLTGFFDSIGNWSKIKIIKSLESPA